VADIYEALTAERPYRGPLERGAALEIIRRDVPHRLDARAAGALEDLVLGPPFVATVLPPEVPAAPPVTPAPAPRVA
jgi:HD-GYP domain-containing protein (c-di-GMP phosphodiesterase class II)